MSLTKIQCAKGRIKLNLRFFWSLSCVSSEWACEVCAEMGVLCKEHGFTAAA